MRNIFYYLNNHKLKLVKPTLLDKSYPQQDLRWGPHFAKATLKTLIDLRERDWVLWDYRQQKASM